MTSENELRLRLIQARETIGMSQSELAKRLRRAGHTAFTPGRIWELENGKRRLQAVEVPDVCRILRVPPWWLLGMTPAEAAALDSEREEPTK